ncbi:N utilization substance protein B [Listeria monocytogenes]|jgi:transcription antitermination factor NusB|uniref:Transcription antitermination protein NusB n=7 Tax=Listeria TaxID=1637 RepID=NUSB_LISMO|nr:MULTISPECIES: transcription antitermination factor NusB [Listeria]NP_464884.1 transcription antitermination protein NusB [Listeria monocytogenes EGD-e]C1L2R5.1 RecName: Full=Transcription antitermination protein NusB; AltName: Full=Antitermination factor NusB [Listeria monocytogenes serotype 4b str. CLIP 80459]Q71ZW3.1 RecName: Full=Transcription antitermination protein NusB; AltName: Full=Antitermination factor NusB [Listeria monocytogenes serotype 4b str. F2365]Q8Y7C6.1 RecName: Full=Trans
MKRREAREKALQALFQIELNEMSLDQAIKNIMEDEQDDYMEKLVEGVMANKAEIDAIIEPNLDNWRMDRLSKVDLSLLRLSVYEIKYLDDVPNRVSLNESIEIAKIYSDEKSSKFINGVLANIAPEDK